jgi:hypothetical protein
MSLDNKHIIPTLSEMHRYPASHWNEISQFVTGDKRDPKDLFYLAADVWDALSYTAHGLPSQPGKFRFHFGHLRSFLKPYIKWYCYQHLLANNGTLSRYQTTFPNSITRTDTYLVEHHYESPDDITTEDTFRALWDAQLIPQISNNAVESRAMVRLQVRTHAFWRQTQRNFGFPQVVPSTAPHQQIRLTESAFDEHQVIPMTVIRQFANKLALHRDGREKLNRFHHLRLCVLMLTFALGRRINEIVSAPRGAGQQGPLTYYPAKGSGSQGSLWFQFSPNKNGPQDHVYISQEWEDVVKYCVGEIIRYGDEIRDTTISSVQRYLILISRRNLTSGPEAARALPAENIDDPVTVQAVTNSKSKNRRRKGVKALSYDAFYVWLHGQPGSPGILEKWRITTDGSVDGEIYQLRTHQARHTRQSAIANDPLVSPLSRQRDLNHTDRNMQTHYQHSAHKQNEILLEKAKKGKFVGPAMKWFSALFTTSDQNVEQQLRYQLGQPQLLSPRWRNLIQNNPQFMQFNQVPCGYCALPQGPGACDDYRNCTEAEDGGCRWFLTDPGDSGMLIQITQTVHKHRQQEQKSINAGREVRAEKYGILAQRSASLEKEAFSHCDIETLPNCSLDLKERLKARKHEIEEEGLEKL